MKIEEFEAYIKGELKKQEEKQQSKNTRRSEGLLSRLERKTSKETKSKCLKIDGCSIENC